MNNKLYVGNLPFSTSEEELNEVFSKTGNVVKTIIPTDNHTGRSRGFGFVEMGTDQEAEQAISDFNNFDFNGRTIIVNIAKRKENKRNDPRKRNFNR